LTETVAAVLTARLAGGGVFTHFRPRPERVKPH
jgi:hypothetical protein